MKTSRSFQIIPAIANACRYYQSLPPVAKSYALVCFMTTAAAHVELYNTRTIALYYSDVFRRFQVWRLVTNFFFLGGFSLPFAFRILAILYYGAALEGGPFDKRTADYIWMYIVGGSSVLVMAIIPFMWAPFNGSAIVFMILYVWSRENPDARVKMKGLFQIKGLLLPWVTLGIDTVFGYPWMPGIQGIAAGHIYFCTVLLPFSTGSYYFKTPHWVHNMVESWAEANQTNAPAKQDPDAEVVFRYRSYRPGGSGSGSSRASARPESSSSSSQVPETTQPTRTIVTPSKAFRGKSRRLLVGR
ncbi:OLC1v1027117C1 [Oldenlandia corymbosa var. corymbosa]|uniref:Derlin n=1 Tax=Oldenlandia corymbosa var. corymbosa TaxID=529605 RepID=A0AAV1C8Q3_OLDCO|nr:OLC1v1027117C1 [Oldenlandia corymbosa var. corymbosa]